MFEATEEPDAGSVILRDILRLDGSELIEEIWDKRWQTERSMILRYLSAPSDYPGEIQSGEQSWYRRRTAEDDILSVDQTLAQLFTHMRIASNQYWPARFRLHNKEYVIRVNPSNVNDTSAGGITEHMLYRDDKIQVIERNGRRVIRSILTKGKTVAVLPWRTTKHSIEHLVAVERNPAYIESLEGNGEMCIIGGGAGEEPPKRATLRELHEETGYEVCEDELVSLGGVYVEKDWETYCEIFTVDLTGHQPIEISSWGGRRELDAITKWMSKREIASVKDSLLLAALMKYNAFILEKDIPNEDTK
jgi:methionyl-tRNA formyltransferase